MSSDNTSLLLLVGAGVGIWYMYTRQIWLFAPASSQAAALAPQAGGKLTSTSQAQQHSGSTSQYPNTPAYVPPPPPTVPSTFISPTPYASQLPVYTTPVIAPTPLGVPINWQGLTTYAAQLQVYLNGKGMATADAYQGIYQCMANVSGGGSRSPDAWGQVLGQCLGEGNGPAGALVTGSSDQSPISLAAYWRFISPFGVPGGMGGFQPMRYRYQ